MDNDDLRWQKEKRILKRADFSLCYDKGYKIHSRLFLAFILQKDSPTITRVGFAVTKKIGNAVTRNRIKRLLREYCRNNQHALPLYSDVVITPKKHIHSQSIQYSEVEEELHKLFKKIP